MTVIYFIVSYSNIWIIGPVAGGVFVAGLGYFMIARTLKQNTQGLVRALERAGRCAEHYGKQHYLEQRNF